MNFKAFNLFTALVGMMLIVLTMLLINAMIQSEATANKIVSEIEEQARLEAAVQMAKNDAAQLFNYYTRQRIESWLTARYNTFTVSKRSSWDNFDEMINEFVQENFSGAKSTAFANYIARNICSLYSGTIGGQGSRFSISVPDCEEQKTNISETLDDAIKTAVENNKFFEVIDCDGTPNNCKKGTFYVYIPLADIPVESYEQLPKIVFTDNFTGRTIKDVILPRQNLKLYVPIRLFKALTWARAFAHSADAIKNNNINSGKDYGVLSPRIHNELEIYGLGLCDKTTCMPRENPAQVPTDSVWKGKRCPNDTIGNEDTDITINFDGSYGESNDEKYKLEGTIDVSEADLLRTVLSVAVEKRVCFISEKLLEKLNDNISDEIDQELTFIQDEDCVFDVSPEITTTPSKEIVTMGEPNENASYQSTVSLPNTPFFSGSCPLSQNSSILQAHQLGAFKNNNSIDIGTSEGKACENISTDGITAQCATLNSISYVIAIRELKEDYMVNKQLYDKDKDRAFRFKIVDTFAAFDPTKTNCSSSACINNDDCTFVSTTREQPCFPKDWQCITKRSDDPSYKPLGCFPVK